ncbi:hypothetical protein H2201_002444 [Coniosporium apollinis]|uniref:DC-UbP/UBTD2 N-terminal domain-containing protein n=1 Tax=Coniosporium apollinis TaxID=61459 RepID=A0ABQ9NYX3_9PEZI|nr:hypothetical protein H2201_002444 [Coniosporium apollinis]
MASNARLCIPSTLPAHTNPHDSQGCCTSTPRHSPYNTTTPTPATAVDSSRAAITSHPSSPSHTHSFASTPRPSHASHRAPFTTSNKPNTPLRLPPPNLVVHTPHREKWTRRRLAREREAFFDTRVSGRAEVWGVVRMVVELLQAGQVGSAQGVLDAAGCTCPTGEVWRGGVWDEMGGLYEVPDWVVVMPVEVVEEEGEGEGEVEVVEEDKSGGSEEEVGGREKGKARAVEVEAGEVVRVRARLSDRGTDVLVKVGKGERVGGVLGRIREAVDISERQKLKIAYLGKVLQENESLAAQGWREGHVVNVLVFPPS